ncbi:MAG: pyridoxamine 5'-phosphate oxidase family protein [Proteobacteria bacterium]|nr:pyridoxamine 5'-phosphate oxidase family protein [Pseudomonadota bacterium]
MTNADQGDAGKASPFHAGEADLQARAGVRERVEQLGQVVIRDHLIEQHRDFFALLPTVLVSALDPRGQVWASLLAGAPGFVHALDAMHLRIDALPRGDDPLADGLQRGAPVGLLGLQAHTRRRNRMNGEVSAVDAEGFTVAVRQSFGNCPKYIQAREASWLGGVPRGGCEFGGALLDAALRARIRGADTFFVASRSRDTHAARDGGTGLDISHRGGRPGFIRIDDSATHSMLVIPDFVGNFLFNTLGNLLEHPACALLFVDYEHGGLLQLMGDGEIEWEGAEMACFKGAERLWRFHVRGSVWRPDVLPLLWSAAELAPQLNDLGEWPL